MPHHSDLPVFRARVVLIVPKYWEVLGGFFHMVFADTLDDNNDRAVIVVVHTWGLGVGELVLQPEKPFLHCDDLLRDDFIGSLQVPIRYRTLCLERNIFVGARLGSPIGKLGRKNG